MGKKDKKLMSLLDECNSLKGKKKYKESIRKYREVLNYIRSKIKDEVEQKEELDKIKLEIDQVYSLEIKDIIDQAGVFVDQKKFTNALEEYNKASTSTYNITDTHLREKESNKIEKLKHQINIKIIIEQGNTLKGESRFDEAIKKFEEALNSANAVFDSTSVVDIISTIKECMNLTYSEKIKIITEKCQELKINKHFNDAIEELEKALKITEDMYDSSYKTSEVANIIEQINSSYSSIIKPIINNGKHLIEQNQIDQALIELKNGIRIVNKMHDSEQKEVETHDISVLINPIYSEKILPIIEEGKQLINQENYEQSIQIIDDAAHKFIKALEIAENMVESEQKSKELENIRNIINKTCIAGIKPRKEKGIQLIDQKEFEEAIRELYSVISIAKHMVIPEEQENEELNNVKHLINKVYSAQISDIIESGNSLVELKKNEEAIEIFNTALNITNKMYLSDEMDEEISKIKNSIYQTELKLIISKGNLSDKQEKF